MSKTMTRAAAGSRREDSPLRHRREEGGFVLILSLLILFILTLLGMTSLMNATIQVQIATNENFAAKALYAADAGLADAVATINTDSTLRTAIAASSNWNNTWRHPSSGYIDKAFANAADYSWYLRFKQDTSDLDLDGNTNELVFFNHCDTLPPTNGCFDYPTSMYGPGGGSPIIEVVSDALVRKAGATQSERHLILELGKNRMNIKASGAVTAASNVYVSGNISIDGTSHDENGNAGGNCTDAYPAINVESGLGVSGCSDPSDPTCDPTKGSASLGGSPKAWDNNSSGSVIPQSPEEAIGLCTAAEVSAGTCDALADLQPAAGGSKTDGLISYHNANYDLNDDGTGVLIVHNPLFRPGVWDVSIPEVPDPADVSLTIPNPQLNTSDPDYDATLNAAWETGKTLALQTNAYLTDRMPRTFSQNGNIVFKGAIVADRIDKINGNATVIGAMISLSNITVDVSGTGSAQILYSCDALNIYTTRGYTTKIVWRRL